jgi:hypothetical protein
MHLISLPYEALAKPQETPGVRVKEAMVQAGNAT